MILATRIALCGFLVSTVLLEAQQFPSQERGLGADTAYQLGEIDRINAFNGNLTAQIPIASFPVGPDFSYQFALRYNSTSWAHGTQHCIDTTPFNVPTPDFFSSNAGHGWSLHFGLLKTPNEEEYYGDAPLVYVSSDGGEHVFYEQLHPGSPASPQGNTWFTNDATYLRMRRYTNPNANQCSSAAPGASTHCIAIHFPNGHIHEFRNHGTDAQPSFRLQRMRDPFDNTVDIDYPATGLTWLISDSHGRAHTVSFAEPAHAYLRATSVTVAAFAGSTSTYAFEHTTDTIDRQGFNPPPCAGSSVSETVDTELLTRVVLPDDSYWQMSYYDNDDADVLSGGLEEIRVPAGGRYAYTYVTIPFASQDPDGERGRRLTSADAVATKKAYAKNNAAVPVGTWSYTYQRSPDRTPGDQASAIPCHHETIITDPLGNETVQYFTSSHADHRWSYGLPFTRCAPGAGYSATPPFLSQEIYAGSRATGTRLRSTSVEYASDGPGAGGGLGADDQDKNNRLIHNETVYHDDGGLFRSEAFANFDGLGNFREVEQTGNFSAQDTRSTEVTYNPGNGELVIDPETGTVGPSSTFVTPGKHDPWILGTFTQQSVTVGGDTATTEACFEAATGRLTRRRVLAGATRANADLLAVFDVDAEGFVTSEKLWAATSKVRWTPSTEIFVR